MNMYLKYFHVALNLEFVVLSIPVIVLKNLACLMMTLEKQQLI